MSMKDRTIVYLDGSKGLEGDFPVAVAYTQHTTRPDGSEQNDVVDPIFNSNVTRNLYGRVMTLVEATTESYKLKAVKDLFGKELGLWERDVYESAYEIATKNAQMLSSANNIYHK
jgi:hypothetical protein